MKHQSDHSHSPYFHNEGGQKQAKKRYVLAPGYPLVSLCYVISTSRCGKEAQKHAVPHIKTSNSFSNFDSKCLLILSTSSSTSMAWLPLNDAPTNGGTSLADSSRKFGTRNLTTHITFPSSHRRSFFWPPPFPCSSSGYSHCFAEDFKQ